MNLEESKKFIDMVSSMDEKIERLEAENKKLKDTLCLWETARATGCGKLIEKQAEEIKELKKVKDHCSECGTTEFLCGHNKRH